MSDLNQLQQELNTPEKLHNFATHYNWDDGFEVPKWIINNPLCDRGTALLMYWHANPQYFCKYATRNEVPSTGWNLQHYDLIQEIEDKYLSGFYEYRTILFNPRNDMSNGMEGHDWTPEYDGEPQRKRIALEMFEPSIPNVLR